MDYIIAIILIIIFVVNIIVSIWSAKVNCKEQAKESKVIYCMYKELERYNNNFENKENKSCDTL